MVCGKYVKMGNPLMAMEYKQYTKGREWMEHSVREN